VKSAHESRHRACVRLLSGIAMAMVAACGKPSDPAGAASSTTGSAAGTVVSSAPPVRARDAAGDPGKAALAAVALDPPAAEGSIAPNVQASGDDVLATWIERASPGTHRLRFSRLRGDRWSAPATIVENARVVANWADVPTVVASGDGHLVASWAESSGPEGHAYDALVARSTDGGASWERIGRLHEDASRVEHGFVTLVPDGAAVRAFWLDGRETARPDGTTQLRTAVVGARVEREQVVDPSVCDCCQTTGAATPGGPVVAYRDRTPAEVRDIWSATSADGSWSAASVATDGWKISGCPVNGPSMASRDDLLAVGWYTYANSTHRVRLAFSRDRGKSFGAAVEVDAPNGTRAPVGRASVVVDGETAIVGWMASDREQAKVLVRRVSVDGSVGPEVVIGSGSAGRDGGFPRLARTARHLVVSWTQPDRPSRIRLVRIPLEALPHGNAPAAPATPTERAAARVGDVAPNLSAETLEGGRVELSSLRGRVVLLNVWATWCEPCRHEMPDLAALHAAKQGKGFTVLALNVDRHAPRETVKAFAARRKLPFPVWLDTGDRAPSALSVGTYPANILVGRDGTIRWRRDGAITSNDADLLRAIDEALAEK
jgi:thiol-disulfide isomerase/thioredoxin